MAIHPYTFQQLAETDIYPDHCGPVSLKYATGRDDLSVLDCATALMSRMDADFKVGGGNPTREATTGYIAFTPGASSEAALDDIYGDLGFTNLTRNHPETISRTMERLAERGYTHGAITLTGHIVPFRDGVIYDQEDDWRLSNQNVRKVWARRGGLTDAESSKLDERIATGRASGHARDYCLGQIDLINQRLDELKRYPPMDVEGQTKQLLANLARWRAYCDSGDVVVNKDICQAKVREFAAESRRAAKYGHHEDAQRAAALRDLWKARCKDTERPTLDLCEHRLQTAREFYEALLHNERTSNDAWDSPPAMLRKKYIEETQQEIEKWERLCADQRKYKQERYAPKELGYFSPAATPPVPNMLQRREFPADTGKPDKTLQQRSKEPKAALPDAAGGGTRRQPKEGRKVIAPRNPQSRQSRRVKF